ncbi:hypothetical protein Tco_0121989 [Tanacetum coccineum]
MGVSRDLRGDSWSYVPRSLFWREDLDRDGERGFDLCSSFVEGPPRRLLVVIRRRSHSSFEGETFEPKRRCCGLSAKELNDFLSSYPIPSEYDVILPTSTQTIFDAPPEVTVDAGESPKAGVFVVHPGSVAARIKERKCKTRGGYARPPVKRKLASGSSSSRVVRAKNSASKDDAHFLPISDDDEGKLLMDLELLDLHDRCYARQAVVDNATNRRAREFLQVIERISGEDDVIKVRERSREEECEGLRAKCEAAMTEFDQNPAVLALREKISSLSAEVKEHKGNLDRMMLESQKWAGYQVTLSALELKVTSLEADKDRLEAVEVSLCGKIEELRKDRRDVVLKVAAMKEPFDLSMVKGYRSSYQKEHTQSSNDFATAAFPWLDEFVANAATLIEALLSKKPPILQKLAPSRTLMHAPSS